MSEALERDSLQGPTTWQAAPHPAPLQGVQWCTAKDEGCLAFVGGTQSAPTTDLGSLGPSDLSLLAHEPSSHSSIEYNQYPNQDA